MSTPSRSEVTECKRRLVEAEKQTKADVRMMKDISDKMLFYKHQMEKIEDRLRSCNKDKDEIMTELRSLKSRFRV